MEGKAVLFKKFANIDVFDIEIDETDVDKLVEIVGISGTDLWWNQSGGYQGAGMVLSLNSVCRERLNIPVFTR